MPSVGWKLAQTMGTTGPTQEDLVATSRRRAGVALLVLVLSLVVSGTRDVASPRSATAGPERPAL